MEKYVEEFLLASLFGSDYKDLKNDPITIAINRAYRDFCRTIRDINNLGETKDNTTQSIKSSIENLCCSSREKYDEWHKKLCSDIVNKGYTFGQAQKWVNMTMKYLLVLKYKPVEKIIDLLHIPLDSVIINEAVKETNNLITKKELKSIYSESPNILNKKGQPAEFSWSRINSYNKYYEIQDIIRKNLENKKGINNPIYWEFQAWNESSTNE